MNKKQFLEYIGDVDGTEIPDDAEICLSEYLILEEDLFGCFDIPIIGIAYNKETNEIRFISSSSSKEALNEIENRIKGLKNDL